MGGDNLGGRGGDLGGGDDLVGGGELGGEGGDLSPSDHVTYPIMHLISPPPVNRMTDTCENITFARYAMRAVKNTVSKISRSIVT